MQSAAKKYISDILKKMNLVEFIEKEARVNFSKAGGRHVCICPMPSHRDSKPSFGVGETSNGVWLYNCFGCGSGGTIIDFVKDYYGVITFEEAVGILMEKFEIKSDVELITKAIKEVKVTVDFTKELECEHIATASACRNLLRKKGFDPEVKVWVGQAYRKMNVLLEKSDRKGILALKQEAIRKLV